MQENSQLSVLVVDPNPAMRNNLQTMLTQAGIGKVEFAVNSSTAIRALQRKQFDVILCEYDLGGASGDGQDGQQLLEDLRHHKLIGLFTIFIMLTAEAIYDKVVSAAELTPTDYILKPFTVDALVQRIGRAIERRNAFMPVYLQIGQGNLREAIRLCQKGEKDHPRHATDFARLRAEMHASLKEYRDAEETYKAILNMKPTGWAALGLARVMFAQGRLEDTKAALKDLIASNPRLMAAYDLLARCHETEGDQHEAKQVLEDAVTISPHMVRRLRKLGEVAFEVGDVNAAEKSFKQVVSKARYSEFRNPEDHVNLVRTLVKKGDTTQASGVVRDLERSLRGSPGLDVCKSYSHALLHEAAGNKPAAASELQNAANAVKASTGLSASLKVGLARACLANQLDAEASEVMLTVVNDVQSEVTAEQALDVFAKAGRPDLANGMGERLKAQAQQLLAVADEKRNMGDVRGAVQTLLEALHIAPRSVQVKLAVVGGVLRQMNELGWDHPLGELVNEQLHAIREMEPDHARLQALTDELNATRRKYGISTTA